MDGTEFPGFPASLGFKENTEARPSRPTYPPTSSVAESLLRTTAPSSSAKGGDVDAAEKTFLTKTTNQGLTGLNGHRSVGGIRTRNYNSNPMEVAEKLATFIASFAQA